MLKKPAGLPFSNRTPLPYWAPKMNAPWVTLGKIR